MPAALGGERISQRDRRQARLASYEIARWFRFRPAAVSLTFDDGTLDQYLVAFPELEARGLKATFFVITEGRASGSWQDGAVSRRLFNWDQAREMARAGHEIASHSATHDDLSTSRAPFKKELADSLTRLTLEVRGRGSALAWPYWRSSLAARKAASRGYLGARSGTAFVDRYVERGVPPATPRDLLDVNALAALVSATDDEWMAAVDYARFRGGWFVACFHGIDDGTIEPAALGWEALSAGRFGAALDWLASQNLWIAPFGRTLRYIKQRDRAVLVRDEADDDVMTYRLLDGLDNEVYDQALSVRVPLPPGWRDARVLQSGVEMFSSCGYEGLAFDAVPDGSPITIHRLP